MGVDSCDGERQMVGERVSFWVMVSLGVCSEWRVQWI